MGYGLPAAIGVQMAHPHALVVDIAGEGSILMNIQELSTAAQYRLPVKIFILNNEYLGMVRQCRNCCTAGAIRRAIRRRCQISSNWRNRLAAMASVARIPADLDAAIAEMIETPNMVVFDCHIGQDRELPADDPI